MNQNTQTQTDIKQPEIGDKVLYVMEGGRAEGKIPDR
jgi:translation elongation factor P/translation initiation factor 5A